MRSIGPRYPVWFGPTLQALISKSPPGTFTVERVREISKNIKDALLAWQYPAGIAKQLGCEPSAKEVVFNLVGWTMWDRVCERTWP
jgi:hypothetical protein